MVQSGPIRLNLGCGLQTNPAWVNLDGSWNARLAKHPRLRRALTVLRLMPSDKADIKWSKDIFIHDIRKRLPFSDGAAEAIYASHVLEHLYREQGKQLIEEAFRVLGAGGILRVVVPDVRAIVREYLGERPFGQLSQQEESVPAADRLNERLLLRWPSPPRKHFLYQIYNAWQDFHSHKWMYDVESLSALFQAAGFVDVREKGSGESLITDIATIEQPSRVLNGVCIEGRKPDCGS